LNGRINGIQVTIVLNLFIFMCILGSTKKFSCWKGVNKNDFFLYQMQNNVVYVNSSFLTIIGSKVNSPSDNPWEQWMVLVATSWIEKLNPCYDKWLKFTNFYLFMIGSNGVHFDFLINVPILKFWNIIHMMVLSQCVLDSQDHHTLYCY